MFKDCWNILKKTWKDCKRAVRSEKRNFKKNIAQKDKKYLASYIKSKTKSRANVRPLSAGSEIKSNDEEMAIYRTDPFLVLSQKKT